LPGSNFYAISLPGSNFYGQQSLLAIHGDAGAFAGLTTFWKPQMD
jgi:hypothetical protein